VDGELPEAIQPVQGAAMADVLRYSAMWSSCVRADSGQWAPYSRAAGQAHAQDHDPATDQRTERLGGSRSHPLSQEESSWPSSSIGFPLPESPDLN